MPNLFFLFTLDIEHKTNQFIFLLSTLGHNLTWLHLKELWSFKYSLLRAIEHYYPELSVEKHLDLANSVSACGLARLTELHLMGPFGSQLARYLLSGCVQLV